MSCLDPIVDDLPPNDHYQYEVFKHVNEVVLACTIILGQTDLSKVRHLLQIVVLEGDIPAKGLTKVEQEVRILVSLDETRSLYHLIFFESLRLTFLSNSLHTSLNF